MRVAVVKAREAGGDSGREVVVEDVGDWESDDEGDMDGEMKGNLVP
jgi:hypothetical protein